MVPGWVSFTAWPAWVSVYQLSNQRVCDLNWNVPERSFLGLLAPPPHPGSSVLLMQLPGPGPPAATASPGCTPTGCHAAPPGALMPTQQSSLSSSVHMSGTSFKFLLSPGGVPGLQVIAFQHRGGGEPREKGPLGTRGVEEWGETGLWEGGNQVEAGEQGAQELGH